ncbi:MAG: GGDEF domain-containing protein [Planctomycetota bacterium]
MTSPILLSALDLCDEGVAIVGPRSADDFWCNEAFARLAKTAACSPEEFASQLDQLSTGTSENGTLQTTAEEFWIELAPLGAMHLKSQTIAAGSGDADCEDAGIGQRVLVVRASAGEHGRHAHGLSHDVVTELPDRRALERELGNRFEEGKPFALLFVDLNGFKQVNDTLGHLAGDRTLREVAHRFRDALRDEDLVARYGGDEFVVLADGVSNHAAAEQIIARLELAVAEPIESAGATPISASIGVAFSVDDFESPQAMLHAADRRMYAHKRSND